MKVQANRQNQRLTFPYMNFAFVLLAVFAFGLVLYYIAFPSWGFFHSDCTDTILWAQATQEAKAIFHKDFYYAALMPFGGHLLMVPFIQWFGVSSTTQIIGMGLFAVLFAGSLIYVLRSLKWNLRWTALTVFLVFLVLSASSKLREIFWGHIIYYSLGALFLLVGMGLVFRVADNLHAETRKENVRLFLLLLGTMMWFILCSTNGVQALTLFSLPMIFAVFAECFLDMDNKHSFQGTEKMNWINLTFVIVVGSIAGYVIGGIIKKGFSQGYADAYSNYSDPSVWMSNLDRFLPQWTSLLGVQVGAGDSLASMDGIIGMLGIFTSFLLLVAPVLLTLQYMKIQDRKLRLLILAHWGSSGLVLYGYVFGLLSATNWRLTPVLFTSLLLTIAYGKWLQENGKSRRLAILVLVPLILMSMLSAAEMLSMKPDYRQNEGLPKITSYLRNGDYSYGYATFWNANAITVMSDSEVKVRGIIIDDTTFRPYEYQSQAGWYESQPGVDTYFVLLTDSEYQHMLESGHPLLENVQATMEQDGFRILTYASNLFHK